MAHVVIDKERCKGCGLCINACPKKILDFAEEVNDKGYHFATIQEEKCIGCAFCGQMCPEVAIEVFK